MIYLELFYEFFKIGLFTFGGGYAMIPLVKEAVLNNNWMEPEKFSSLIGICESTPGPVAVNMATFVGTSQAGILGGLCATIGVVLPSLIIILLIASILNKFANNKHFKNFIKGVKPVVTALILSTGLIILLECIGVSIKVSEIHFDFKILSLVIFVIIALMYIFIYKVFNKKITSIQLIIISAILGIVLSLVFV